MEGVNRSVGPDPGGTKHNFSTYRWILTLYKEVLTIDSWWQGRIPVESVVMLRLLNMPNTLLWLPGEMSVILMTLVRLLDDLFAPGRKLKILDAHFSASLVRPRLLILILMVFFWILWQLVCYLGILSWCGRCWLGVVVGNAICANCIADMTIVLFYSIFQTYAGFPHVRKVAVFF